MNTCFETISGEIIDLSQADRVYAGRLVNINDMNDYSQAVLVDFGPKTHVLVTTGKDKTAAEFHAQAIRESLNHPKRVA